MNEKTVNKKKESVYIYIFIYLRTLLRLPLKILNVSKMLIFKKESNLKNPR